MKREEAIANAMSVLTYCELKNIGHIRSFTDYESLTQICLHFRKLGEEVYEAKKEIHPLLTDGTIIEVCSYPEKGYETLDISWETK